MSARDVFGTEELLAKFRAKFARTANFRKDKNAFASNRIPPKLGKLPVARAPARQPYR